MTLWFFLLAGCLILVALVLVLPPIWRTSKVTPDDIDQRNIQIARQRLAELKANRDAGGIDQTQFEEQVNELELGLIDDLSIDHKLVESGLPGRWMAYVLAGIIPLFSAGLYWVLGDYQAVGHSAEMAVAGQGSPSAEDIAGMVEGLAERMRKDPDNAEGWVMLGRSYSYLTQYPKAADAFANAYRLVGDNPEIMLQYAEALAFSANKNLAGKPSELIFKALDLEPNNPTGLWLGGLAKVQQGDSGSALTLWRKLENLLPVDSPSRQQVQSVIAGMEGKAVDDTDALQESAGARAEKPALVIEVSLAAELASWTNSNETVFIYAQALSGPKMPLAIIRKKITDLPVKVILDDSLAMTPAMKLSDFTEVRLVARVSKSGQAVSQSGDLIGSVEKAKVANKGRYKIIIDQRVP